MSCKYLRKILLLRYILLDFEPNIAKTDLRAVKNTISKRNLICPRPYGQRPVNMKNRTQQDEAVMAGTNLPQDEYLELEKTAAAEVLTDAEAILLINNDFGFEAARIEILHEAEIDVTESGSRYVRIKKEPRKPLHAASDWNYIRFNVRTRPAIWHYEMINGSLRFVEI